MKRIVEHNQFKSDIKRIKRSGNHDIENLLDVLDRLANNKPLEPKHRDHALSGNWSHYRECHIKPDWLLVYRLEQEQLVLVRTGSHSELF